MIRVCNLEWARGVTENGEVVDGTYKELMSVNVICHVLSLISRPLREVGSRRHRVGKLGVGSIRIVEVARN